LYYTFYPAAVGTDAEFQQQVDAVCRELGDRGKPKLQEAIPPSAPALARFEPTPAPAPAPARAPAPAPALAVAPATPRPTEQSSANAASFTPSMQQIATPMTPMGGGSGVMEIIALLKEERQEMKQELQQMREEQTTRKGGDAAAEAISHAQLTQLQARIEALHSAALLTDEELFILEDLVSDVLELKVTPASLVTVEMALRHPPVAQLCKLVVLSEGIATDAAFARQARRKCA
jgi:hypothetical protein